MELLASQTPGAFRAVERFDDPVGGGRGYPRAGSAQRIADRRSFGFAKALCSSGHEGRFRVQDLDSRNGTLVNGAAVQDQWLKHGDEIAAAIHLFCSLLEEKESAPAPGRVEFEESQLTAETTIIHPRDVVYLQPERLQRELPATSRWREI